MSSRYPPETRRDRLTRQWVSCAPSRSERPLKTESRPPPSTDPTEDTPVEGCPFCPGHEAQLPEVLWEKGSDDDRPWRTRAVPNKFSALTPDAPPSGAPPDLYEARPSRGRQEVLIDTPYHHEGLARMPLEQIEAVLETYRTRYRRLRDEDLYPFVFRNHGAGAGASIPHPHSQIIATPFAPPAIEREEAAAEERYDETGRCPYCEMIETELEAQVRLVWTDDNLVVFVPFAAEVPYELWMLPRRHEPEFGTLSPPVRSSLAAALQSAVRRLYEHLDDPDYNFFLRTALQRDSDAPHLHWSLRLRPRTTMRAGFEVGTGLRINPSIPERDAAVLRGDDSPSDSGAEP